MAHLVESVDGAAAKTARVLVVDDSRVIRMAVKGFLRATGYVVDEACDGRNALRLLESAAYDVVVSDLAMPGVDGFGLLEALRTRPDRPEVIILTGSDNAEVKTAVRALDLGAHDYLTKPPSGPQAVVLAVNRAIEKKRLREGQSRLAQRVDAVSGLPGREAFEETLAKEIGRAGRHDLPLSLILVRVDPAAGDEALKHVSRLLTSSLRTSDSVFRYEHGTFAVLLPHTPSAGALVAARRLVSLVEDLRLTCRAGVAGLDGAGRADDLLHRAAAALDEAKKGGPLRGRAQQVPLAH